MCAVRRAHAGQRASDRRVRPFGVDTASGTESAPGRKDPAKLEAFFRAVAAADARAGEAAVSA